jgi:hypothetical protein
VGLDEGKMTGADLFRRNSTLILLLVSSLYISYSIDGSTKQKIKINSLGPEFLQISTQGSRSISILNRQKV